MLNQQDLAKNGWGHHKSGWGEVDSACAHAWHRSCLSLEAAFLPVIDDLPAFVLLISMVRSPHNPPPPFLSFPSSAFPLLLPPLVSCTRPYLCLYLGGGAENILCPTPKMKAEIRSGARDYCPPPSCPLFLHPPIPPPPPSHHSLTLMPSSPSLKALNPVTPSPMFQVSSIYCMGSCISIKTSTHFLEARTGYCCIHI